MIISTDYTIFILNFCPIIILKMEAQQPIEIQTRQSAYSWYFFGFLGWTGILVKRFFKGVFDGILFTPVFEALFWFLKNYPKRTHEIKMETTSGV